MVLAAMRCRVCCPPRLGAAGRRLVSRRQLPNFLKNVLDRYALFKSRADHLFMKGCSNVFANDEHDLPESGAMRVIDRIVHDGLAIRSNWIDLLQSSVAAAHPSGQNEECRVTMGTLLSQSSVLCGGCGKHIEREHLERSEMKLMRLLRLSIITG